MFEVGGGKEGIGVNFKLIEERFDIFYITFSRKGCSMTVDGVVGVTVSLVY